MTSRGRLEIALVAGLAALGLVRTAGAAEVVKYYHSDAIGNVRAVTDRDGNVLERFEYYPFGEDVAPPSTPTHRRFTGKERDDESGLDYFGARHYLAKTARFTSVDPVYTWSENLGDPQRWNRYAYARNNPIRYTDPDGRVINEANAQDNREYQKWRAAFLSQGGGQAQWDALDGNPAITVNLGWDQKAEESITGGYVWDDAGTLTTVNVTLGGQTGKSSRGVSAAAGYVYGSTLSGNKERQAYVFSHEFAHVEYAQTAEGMAALKQKDRDNAFLAQSYQAMTRAAFTSSPNVAATDKRLRQGGHDRGIRADARAKEVLTSKP